MALTLANFKEQIRTLALMRRSGLLDEGSYVEAVDRLRLVMYQYFDEDTVYDAFEEVWDELPTDY